MFILVFKEKKEIFYYFTWAYYSVIAFKSSKRRLDVLTVYAEIGVLA